MSRGDRARLFAALDLPGRVRDDLAGWARRVRRERTALRLVEPEMLHVTLCFLGSRPVGEIDAIAAAVSACGAPIGGLSLGAPLWLPPRRPRVLAVEVHDEDGALGELQRDLVRELARAIEWGPERRRFRAHVTVARLRAGAAPRQRELEATPSDVFAGEAVTLYRSWLSPAGATYQALARVEVG